MEIIHNASKRKWISKRINLNNFISEWSTSLRPPSREDSNLYLTGEEMSGIAEECGLDALGCNQDRTTQAENRRLNIPDDIDLETLNLQEADLIKREENRRYEMLFYNFEKFHAYPSNKLQSCDVSSDCIPYKQVSQPDVLLMVQIYRPEKRFNSYQKSNFRIPIFKVDQEFLVLGSQFLTELRDRIQCISDRAIPGDFSDCPLREPDVTCKELYKSGYFYINDVFYNDMRDPDCKDYSENIIKWAEDKKRGIGPFSKTLMEKTRFIDLDIQLGYPYVYMHQGDCEHVLVFCDLRMFDESYPSNRNEYPLFVNLKPKKPVYCLVCHIYTARWIVYDNKRLPENPFFFCKKCFLKFNYKDGKKIGEFTAYHFIDRSTLT